MIKYYKTFKLCFFALFVLMLNSCIVVDFLFRGTLVKGNYSYNYAGERKAIDFMKGKWLIASENQYDIDFFGKFLGNRLTPLNTAKDSKGKLLIQNFKTPISEKELKSIHSLTDYEYLITFGGSTQENDVRSLSFSGKKTEDSYSESSIVNVYDIKTGFLEYQIICTGNVEVGDDRILGLDTKYRVLKKIEKYAVF